jgi:hypothetical protein
MGKKISSLTATTTLTDTDVIPLVQSGATRKITKANLKKALDLLGIQTFTTSRTLGIGDQNVRMNSASANNVTVPNSSTANFDIGTVIIVRQVGAGITSFVAAAGVTINASGFSMGGANTDAILKKVGTNEWDLSIGGASSSLTALAVPGSFDANTISSSQINLTWSDVSNEVGYEIEQSPDGSVWSPLNSPAANATSYNHTGISPSTTVFYHIRAKGDNITYSDSAWSSPVSDTTSAPGAVQLNTPGSFAAAPASGTQINLTWTDTNSSPNETNLEIEVATLADHSDNTVLTSPAANATTYAHTGLSPATTRYYRIRAKGNGSTTTDSNFSAWQSATTTGSLTFDTLPWFTYYKVATLGTTANQITHNTGGNDFFTVIKDISGNHAYPSSYDLVDPGSTAEEPKYGTFIESVSSAEIDSPSGNQIYNNTAFSPLKSFPLTRVAVVRFPVLPTLNKYILYNISGTALLDVGILGASSGNMFVYAGGGIIDTGFAPAANTTYLVWVERDADKTTRVYVNNSLKTTVADTGATQYSGSKLGDAANGCRFYYSRGGIIDSVVSSTDRTTAYNNLKTIFTSLP